VAPGRGAPGRGATGAELNGLLPTRGVLWTGALGPGLGPARSSAAAAAAGSAAAENSAGLPCSLAGTGAWAAGATAAAGASGVAGCATAGCATAGCATAGCATAGCTAAGSSTGGASAAASSGLGPGRGPGRTPAGAAFAAGAVASTFAVASAVATGAAEVAGNAPRRRRATGASTVDDADFTNSPCSFSLASTSLLVTPSSFASSCTRALPATALLTGRPGGKIRTTSVYNRRTFITEASRGAHEFFACLPRWTCSVFTGPP